MGQPFLQISGFFEDIHSKVRNSDGQVHSQVKLKNCHKPVSKGQLFFPKDFKLRVQLDANGHFAERIQWQLSMDWSKLQQIESTLC